MKKSFILTGIFIYIATLLSFSQQSAEKGKFTNYTEGGVLVGNSQDEKKAPFVFHSSVNYGLYKNLSAGVGVGVEFLRETYLPVTANVMYQFRKTDVIFPFIRIRTGYQVALESTTAIYNNYYYLPILSTSSSYYPGYYPTLEKLNAKGGWLIDPSVGVTVYTRARLGFSLSAGYRYQKLKYTSEDDYILWAEYNRLLLTLGITF